MANTVTLGVVRMMTPLISLAAAVDGQVPRGRQRADLSEGGVGER